MVYHGRHFKSLDKLRQQNDPYYKSTIILAVDWLSCVKCCKFAVDWVSLKTDRKTAQLTAEVECWIVTIEEQKVTLNSGPNPNPLCIT